MKTFIKPITATLALITCSCNQNTTPTAQDDPAPIKIYAAVASEVASKAPMVDGSTLTNVRFLQINATSEPTNFTTATPLLANRTAAGAINWVTPNVNYNKKNDKAYFVAYHPATTAAVTEVAATSATWTLDGNTDVLVADRIDAGSYLAPLTPVMTFNHQVAQLNVVLIADPTANLADLRLQYGKITAITLANTSAKLTYTYATRAVTASTADYTIPMRTKAYAVFAPIDIPENIPANINTPVASIMAAPNASGELSIIITSANRGQIPITLQLKTPGSGLDTPFAAGKIHTVIITLTKDTINPTWSNAIITDWKSEYDKPAIDERV